MDLVSDTPLNKEEIVALFNKVLANNGLTAIQDKKTLTIMTTQDARTARNPSQSLHPANGIPADSQIVTDIIPVHSLNPTQIIKDPTPSFRRGAQMNTSESGNAVIITARQSDVRRFVQLIKALDSTGNRAREVFLLPFRRFQDHRLGVEGSVHPTALVATTHSRNLFAREGEAAAAVARYWWWWRRCWRGKCHACRGSRQRRLGRPEQRRPGQRAHRTTWKASPTSSSSWIFRRKTPSSSGFSC